ncbi:MAG: hypothetical protein HRT71_00265 [Flavobacteriales bacterium]|nr:hypothetical protein [Flavobacteriales bacterium]
MANHHQILNQAWPQHQKLMLQIGAWNQLISEEETKQVISVALNYCTSENQNSIIGYLITTDVLYLIIDGDEDVLNAFLPIFHQQIDAGIKGRLSEPEHSAASLAEWEAQDQTEKYKNLFTQVRFRDPFLIQLITGHNVTLPYHSATLESLKAEVKQYHYCSAIDYAGPQGPVLVQTERIQNLMTKLNVSA